MTSVPVFSQNLPLVKRNNKAWVGLMVGRLDSPQVLRSVNMRYLLWFLDFEVLGGQPRGREDLSSQVELVSITKKVQCSLAGMFLWLAGNGQATLPITNILNQ